MPIRPATRPAFSWSPPSCGETVVTSLVWNSSGRAPKLSTLARFCASSWPKPPEITAEPPGMALRTSGWETTWPSSTMANWLVGGCCAASWPVTAVNASVPLPSNCSWTCQPPPCWVSMVAWALVTFLPWTATGPSASL